jgi:hypothetical protein
MLHAGINFHVPLEEAETTIPIPVLGKLTEAFVLKQNEREANLAMANIKARLES